MRGADYGDQVIRQTAVTSLTNAAGSVAQTYTYDSFGKLTASSGSLTNPFRYTGRDFDSETGLYYYRARYFDPNAGRFLSEDPIVFLGGTNFYVYTDNDPTTLVDPAGLQGGPWHPPAGVHTKCLPTDDCATIKGKIWILQRMIASHTGWDKSMPSPRGGNRHSQEISDLWTQLAECQALYEEKCKGPSCQEKQPAPRPAPAPQTKPQGAPLLPVIINIIEDILEGAAAAAM